MSEKVETLSEFCLRLGREEGMQTGRQEGIREGEIIGSIKTLLSLKKSKEEICQYLEKNLNLSPNDALKEVSLLAH